VLVNGRKQGVTKKTTDNKSNGGASGLCKKSLLDAVKRLRRRRCGGGHAADAAVSTYGRMKAEATGYRRCWTAGKQRLGCWTVKPEGLSEFT